MMRLYNTKSRSIEPFIPKDPKNVLIYACGPTVYNYLHIGNLRTYISEDLLVRTLKLTYNVKHIINITDVGHLVSDEDTGEDKMELGAKREGISIWDIAKKFTDSFKKDINELNIIPPTKFIKATDTIQEQINLILELEKLGYTYRLDDGIYYDTSKFSDYGKLGGQNLDELKKGARINFNDNKRNITDFALWKFSKTKRLMEWNSPWGIGFPGWHTECAAMALNYLGDYLDIHCGGIDHIKVHHTNEIAEVTPLINKEWVNFWFHCEFLLNDKEKMAKSSGNFLTLDSLKKEGFSPLEYRYYCLLSHYRTKMAFSFESLQAAAKAYRGLKERFNNIKDGSFNENDFKNIEANIKEIIEDDLNSPKLIAYLWTLLKDIKVSDPLKYQTTLLIDKVLGLNLKSSTFVLDSKIEELLTLRKVAREQKDFKLSDNLRLEIEQLGYSLLDTPKGQVVKPK